MTSSIDVAGDGESHGGGDGSQVDQLRAVVDAQLVMIESLRTRLDRLEGGDARTATPERADGESSAIAARGDDGAASTTRRNLMTRGAAVAAGAAIAGTALNVATASPAAAAAGVFDGNPAVIGMASPTTGNGVQGITTSGYGVLGTASALSGDNAGVGGLSQSAAGVGVKGQATSTTGVCIGVYGVTPSSSGGGIWGEAPSLTGATRGATGIVQSPDGIGVCGQNDSATGGSKGVYGSSSSPDGYGVYGQNLTTGIGVFGIGGTAVVALSGTTQLRLSGAAAVPVTSTSARLPGEIVFDLNHDLWICVSPGSPGTWRRLGGSASVGSLSVLAVTTRIYDSRPGATPTSVAKGTFVHNEERVIAGALGGAVPPGATAVLINATATNTNPGGFFSFFKAGIAWPGTSSLSWGLPGSTIANQAVVAVDIDANFRARCEGVGGADLVIDCVGYYR